MHIDQIMRAIAKDLDSWVKTRKGKLLSARDPLEAIEMLCAGPDGFLVILSYEGDEATDQVEENRIAGQQIGVTVGMGLGLHIDKGALIFKAVGERRNLTKLLSQCKARVLSLEFPNAGEDNAGVLRYAGSEPVTMPDGFPLAAFKFRVYLDALVETDEPREAVIEEE